MLLRPLKGSPAPTRQTPRLSRPRLGSSHRQRVLRVLAFETSCDDTCASIVTSDRQILSNVIIKQDKVHRQHGGIQPYRAMEMHQKNMPFAIQRALKDAKTMPHELDAIAFTRGPGMAGCLATGATAAKALAVALNKPLIGVHHMQAHALTPFLTEDNPPTYPFLTLLVSGGHTLILLCRSPSSFELLSTTTDIAIGNAIDQTVKDLEIPWSAEHSTPGASLEAFLADAPLLPTPVSPLSFSPTLPPQQMSFTGLVAAMHRLAPQHMGSHDGKHAVAKAVLEAAVKQLVRKTSQWVKSLEQRGVAVRSIVASGGVASNLYLRQQLRAHLPESATLYFPPVRFCTDNAAMIAWTALDKLQRGKTSHLDAPVVAKWNIEECEREDTYESVGTGASYAKSSSF